VRKIKILFVHQSLDIGGAEILRKYLLSCLDRERYSVDICCIERKGRIGEDIEKLGYKIITLDRKINIANSIPILWNLCKLIRRYGYEVVHTSLFYANLFGRLAAILTGTPLKIIEEHGLYRWKNKYPIFISADRFLARFTHKIICCSKSVSDFNVSQMNIPREKFVVVRNCVDFSAFNIQDSKNAIRERCSFGLDETIIGIVGTMKEEKGHRYLLEAVDILRKKWKTVKLLIIGEGLLSDHLKKHVDDLGINANVLFLGWRFDIPYLLKAMDMFVLPSVSEGLGISLLEAMYMEVPIVATGIEGIPEVIQDGVNGILVPPRNSELLAKAIEKLILDKRHAIRLATKGKEIAIRNFDARNYTTAIENIYADFFNGGTKDYAKSLH